MAASGLAKANLVTGSDKGDYLRWSDAILLIGKVLLAGHTVAGEM